MRTHLKARLLMATTAAIVLLWATPALAIDLHVDANALAGGDGSEGAPYQSISAAVTAAAPGDSVLVSAGTYAETLVISKGVSIIGAGTDVCTIDAQGTGMSAVGFYAGSSSAVISGFTITGGSGTTDDSGRSWGGGVYCVSASPVVEDCLITGNTANYGAGIAAYLASPTVLDCVIRGNTAGFFGGGLMAREGSPTVNSCVIHSNTASNGDGLFYMMSGSAPLILNSTVAYNGGIGVASFGPGPVITNSVFWGNGDDIASGALAVVSYSCVQDTDVAGLGVTHSDPQFVSVSGSDLALTAGSPCIDTANPADSMPHDMLGTLRPLDGDADTVAAPDMGAYEYDATPPVTSRSPLSTWFATPVTLTLSATDEGGVAATYYFFGTAAPQLYSAPIVLSAEGSTELTFYSVDYSGGTETAVVSSIGLDFTPPATVSDAPLDWQNEAVSVLLTAVDPLSGVASTWYALDGGTQVPFSGVAIPVSAEGTTTVTYGSIDAVGNSESTQTALVRIDLTPPVTTSDAATKYSDAAEITLESSDAMSGVDAIYYSLDGGAFQKYVSPVAVSTVGDHDIAFYAVDLAGNVEAQATAEFEVADTGDGLPHTGGTLMVLLLAILGAAGIGLTFRVAAVGGASSAE